MLVKLLGFAIAAQHVLAQRADAPDMCYQPEFYQGDAIGHHFPDMNWTMTCDEALDGLYYTYMLNFTSYNCEEFVDLGTDPDGGDFNEYQINSVIRFLGREEPSEFGSGPGLLWGGCCAGGMYKCAECIPGVDKDCLKATFYRADDTCTASTDEYLIVADGECRSQTAGFQYFFVSVDDEGNLAGGLYCNDLCEECYLTLGEGGNGNDFQADGTCALFSPSDENGGTDSGQFANFVLTQPPTMEPTPQPTPIPAGEATEIAVVSATYEKALSDDQQAGLSSVTCDEFASATETARNLWDCSTSEAKGRRLLEVTYNVAVHATGAAVEAVEETPIEVTEDWPSAAIADRASKVEGMPAATAVAAVAKEIDNGGDDFSGASLAIPSAVSLLVSVLALA